MVEVGFLIITLCFIGIMKLLLALVVAFDVMWLMRPPGMTMLLPPFALNGFDCGLMLMICVILLVFCEATNLTTVVLGPVLSFQSEV